MVLPEYLYHYTSIESLALILKNRTILFNNLLNVDDTDEAKSSDMGNFGKFIYVSCWTDSPQEIIPFWGMYTPNMHGVRIRMKTMPFKQYFFKKGMYHFKNDTSTFIDYEQLYRENALNITADQPKIINVIYSDKDEDLYPKVRRGASPKEIDAFFTRTASGNYTGTVSYSLEKLGRYKRTDWAFQHEWRYVLSCSPIGIRSLENATPETHQHLLSLLEDRNYLPEKKELFLMLSDDALNDIEITLGPRMGEAEKIIVYSLVNEYVPTAYVRPSSLHIR